VNDVTVDFSRLFALAGAATVLYGLAAAVLWRWRGRVICGRGLEYGEAADDPLDGDPIAVLAEVVPDTEITPALLEQSEAEAARQQERDRAPRRSGSGPAGRLRSRRSGTRPSWPALAVLATALAGLGAAGWAFHRASRIEPYALETVEIVVPLPQMEGHPPVTIVQLSDLHVDGRNRVEPLLAPYIEQLKPDMIVFTGDIVNRGPSTPDPAGREAVAHKTLWDIARLRPQASFACLGNRDGGTWYRDAETGQYRELLPNPGGFCGEASDPVPPERRLTWPVSRESESWRRDQGSAVAHPGHDFRLLVGEAVRWKTESGVSVWVAGGGVARQPVDEIDLALRHLAHLRQPGDIGLLLGHYPSMVRQAAASGAVDLHLAGDTHNGEIALPFLGALARKTVDDGVFYANALHRGAAPESGRSVHLYVSRGIGTDDQWGLSMRLCNRPEVTVIRLVSPSSAEASRATPWLPLSF